MLIPASWHITTLSSTTCRPDGAGPTGYALRDARNRKATTRRSSSWPAAFGLCAPTTRIRGKILQDEWLPAGAKGNTAPRGCSVTTVAQIDAKRSAMMARIGPRDTAPELAVRRALH